MKHSPLSSVPSNLLRVASSINEDIDLPLRVPVLTIAFLHRLGRHCDHSTKPLGRFLLTVQYSDLVDEITRILLPKEIQELRAEIERLQLLMEDTIAHKEWEQAIVLRDQKVPLQDRLHQMKDGNAIHVQSDHLMQAITNLGFNETINLSEWK